MIFADQKFADKKRKAIVEIKIMTKSREKLDNFNDTIIIRLENNNIYLYQITQSNYLQSIKKINVDMINSRNVIRLDFTLKK